MKNNKLYLATQGNGTLTLYRGMPTRNGAETINGGKCYYWWDEADLETTELPGSSSMNLDKDILPGQDFYDEPVGVVLLKEEDLKNAIERLKEIANNMNKSKREPLTYAGYASGILEAIKTIEVVK